MNIFIARNEIGKPINDVNVNSVLPDSIEDIQDHAFHEREMIASIQIPLNVARIGKGAFRWCLNLEEIILPQNLKEIGEWAFSGCTVSLLKKWSYTGTNVRRECFWIMQTSSICDIIKVTHIDQRRSFYGLHQATTH